MNILSATGNLGSDCKVNQVGQSTVCNFSVAMKSGFGDKAQTIWLDCALWGKQAESQLPTYLLKGQSVGVSGELGSREHEGKTYLTLRVNSIDLLGGKSEGQQQEPAPPEPQQQNQQKPQGGSVTPGQGANQPGQMQEPDFDFDDDIPF
jgi:single-strand DNA-binding protein